MLLPWDKIDTVLLDMDGTLLDLHFDNYFWLEYLPLKYAEKYNISTDQAKVIVEQACNAQKGNLAWYCVDYWSREFSLPIMELKQQIAYLIQWHKGAELFLLKLSQMKKQLVLVTNAHPDSLALKAKHTNIVSYFEKVVSSHELGAPKEDVLFWQQLQRYASFAPSKALFIDDSISILRVAKKYGIQYLFNILQPDTHDFNIMKQQEFKQIASYKDFFII